MVNNMADASPRIRCRIIVESDAPALVDLLARGFPERTHAYWAHALDTLARRDAPALYPRFGYLLEHEGAPVGVILTIFCEWGQHGATHTRCNISSWYVDQAFRGYASLLIAAAVRHKNVTYVNLSPAPHTWRVIEAQGFTRYAEGQMVTAPALSPWAPNTRARPFDKNRDYGDALSAEECEILTFHAEHGCQSYVTFVKREAHPFVFLPRRIFHGLLPTLQLVYCRDISEFQRFAGPIGRALLRRGHATVLVDAREHLPGLVGKFVKDRGPKYFKGPVAPRLGDLAFSEGVLFGP